MDLRVLQYYLTAAREENITRAAQLLHITQPTLSRQLQQLEDELGVKLFQRSKHSIYLTPEGLLFRCKAQEIISLAEKAKEELSPLSGCGKRKNGGYWSTRIRPSLKWKRSGRRICPGPLSSPPQKG